MSIHRAVEQTLNSFWSHHAAGHFDDALRVYSTFGIDDNVTAFTFDPDSYYIPNRRGDRLIKPRGTDDDAIPIIGVESAEEIIFERPTLHHLQRIALKRCGIASGPVESAFRQRSGEIDNAGGRPGTASVLSRLAVEYGSEQTIRAKPLVILNIERDGNELLPLCSGATLHELVHVAQHLDDPFYRAGDRLRLELEAYGVVAQLVPSFYVPYSPAIRMAGAVDSFRANNLGRHNYTPTPAFEEVFREDEQLGKILPAKE